MISPVTFEVVNGRAFEDAMKQAPKLAIGEMRKIMRAQGKTIAKKQRNALLSGPPGIYFPARKTKRAKGGKTVFAKGRVRGAGKAQAKNMRTKVNKSGSPTLTNYTSKFIVFHEKKIRTTFERLFRVAVPAINAALLKGVVGVVQRKLDDSLIKGRGPR